MEAEARPVRGPMMVDELLGYRVGTFFEEFVSQRPVLPSPW